MISKKKTNKKTSLPKKFNPVKNDPSKGNADKVIWSTQALDVALEGLNQGFKLKANPFYENNTKLLKADLLFERTPQEMQRFKECMNDILEFAKECQLMTPQGIKYVQMRDYQKRYLKHLQNNRLSIYLSCRQSAKTTTSAIFMLWYSLFNYDKNCLVLGAKYSIAKEILDKIKNIFYYLPYYLRPGIRKWNDSEIVFDNGCRIMAEATTVNSGISFTFHCVLADEFAHVPSNIVDKFYNQIFPTITAGAARFMITSTQNGFNLFYKLYKSAEAKENEYAAFKTDWYEVPEWNLEKECWEPRTEEWHRRMAANLGSEEAFQKQFGTNFDVTGNTLINAKAIRKLQVEAQEFRSLNMPGLLHSDSFKWSPEINDITEIKNMYLTLTIDISEGIGQDSDIINIHRLKWDDRIGKTIRECIGICEIKDITVPEFAELTVDFTSKFCNMNNIILSFESNTFGGLFYKSINTYTDNHPELKFDSGIFARFERDMFSESKGIDPNAGNGSTKYTIGFRVSSATKKGACKLFKAYFEEGLIRNKYTRFISQLENFTDVKGNGSYEASFGHDDIAMTEVQGAALMQTLKYKLFVESFEGDQGNNGEEYIDYYSELSGEDRIMNSLKNWNLSLPKSNSIYDF